MSEIGRVGEWSVIGSDRAQRCRDAEMKRCRGAERQKDRARDAEAQRDRDAETQGQHGKIQRKTRKHGRGCGKGRGGNR